MKVVAVVKPVTQARKKFAKTARKKRTTIHLEGVEEGSEIIMAQLGDIPGETRIKTEFELVLLLERRIFVGDGGAQGFSHHIDHPHHDQSLWRISGSSQ